MANNCEDCGTRNPSIPAYSQAKPLAPNPNCDECNNGNQIFYPPDTGGVGRTTEILAGFSIGVQDLSDALVDRFEVSYVPYVPPVVNQAIIAKFGGAQRNNPILLGTVIDAVESSWFYNPESDGEIQLQTLEFLQDAGDPDPTDPILGQADRNYEYTGLAITKDAQVRITGSDGIESDSDTDSITFGNYLAVGVTEPSMLFQNPAQAQAIFDSLVTKSVRQTQAGYSFNAFGGATEFMVIAYPEAWGESEFTKGTFTGGYNRIRKVNRGGNEIFTVNVEVGDTELPININNNNPDGNFGEPFIFYQSEYPARTGENPTVMSKK